MKRLILGSVFVLGILGFSAGPAFAGCTTQTIIYGGKIVTCTTCCSFGNCTTNCF